VSELKRFIIQFGSSLQLAEGSGEDELFDFNLTTLSDRYKWNQRIMEAVSFLEKADHLILSANSNPNSQLKIVVNHDTLYEVEMRNPKVGRIDENFASFLWKNV